MPAELPNGIEVGLLVAGDKLRIVMSSIMSMPNGIHRPGMLLIPRTRWPDAATLDASCTRGQRKQARIFANTPRAGS
jgi:hypothetical protein